MCRNKNTSPEIFSTYGCNHKPGCGIFTDLWWINGQRALRQPSQSTVFALLKEPGKGMVFLDKNLPKAKLF